VRVLAVLLALFATAFAQESERSGFTITRTELQVQLDPANAAADISGKLAIRNDGRTTMPRVFLQITSTSNWVSVMRDGSKLTFTEHKVKSDVDHNAAVNEARIELDHPLMPHASVVLDVHYAIKVLPSSERLNALGAPQKDALLTEWDRISSSFTGVRGIGYVLWYPVSLEPASLAQGNAVFQAIAQWKSREAESDFVVHAQEGQRRLEKSYTPLGMNVPVLTGVTAPTTIRNSVGVVAPSLEEAQPFVFPNGAEEFAKAWLPPRTTIAKLWILPEEGDVPFTSGSEAFIPPSIDETTAQAVTLYAVEHAALKSPRAWIQEGYAAFLDAAFRQHERGPNAALKFLVDRVPALSISEPEGANATDTSLINSGEEVRYRTKAMFVWWMLRSLVGDAALQNAIKKYRVEEDSSADYIEKLLEAESHKDLSAFFEDWVYRDRGLPDLSITNAVVQKAPDGSWMTQVFVANDGGAIAIAPLFVAGGDDVENAQVSVPAHSKATVEVKTTFRPQSVRVNDGSVPETDMNNNQFEIK
jgi:hypothetical protein